MKTILLLLTAAALATTSAFAQELMSQEEALKAAKLLIESAATQSDLQFKTSPLSDKTRGIKAGDVGLIVIPDARLTSDALAKAGKEMVPVGQLWTRVATAAKDNRVTPNSKLRLVEVTAGDQKLRLQFYLLGVQRTDKDKLELVLFGKDKEALLKLPLDKADASAEFPIELSGRKTGDESGVLTLTILGKHKAELPLLKQED